MNKLPVDFAPATALSPLVRQVESLREPGADEMQDARGLVLRSVAEMEIRHWKLESQMWWRLYSAAKIELAKQGEKCDALRREAKADAGGADRHEQRREEGKPQGQEPSR